MNVLYEISAQKARNAFFDLLFVKTTRTRKMADNSHLLPTNVLAKTYKLDLVFSLFISIVAKFFSHLILSFVFSFFVFLSLLFPLNLRI